MLDFIMTFFAFSRTGECAPDRALDPAVLSRLKLFSAMNKLKKVALQVNKANEY
jgi:hypothetical protein